ncbi:DUF874 domain-containing protein, partial [bacterium LRH843]|nr:DUF874 domain-containing protein [bacterium LRH843]
MDQLREQLRVVNASLAEAEVGLSLESERKAERLTVLEPAALPQYPSTPSRKRNVVLMTAASVVFGVLLAFALDLRK